MDFKKSSEAKKDESFSEKEKNVLLGVIESRVRHEIKRAQKDDSGPASQEAINLGLDNLFSRLLEVLPDKAFEVNEIKEMVQGSGLVDKKELISFVASKICSFLTSHYTPEQIERLAREFGPYQDTFLNRLVNYGVSGNILHIHIPLTFAKDQREVPLLFQDAMEKLATKLQTDPALKDVTVITASSSLVFQAERAIKKFGFTVTSIDPVGEFGEAEITKEKLIELYGDKTTNNG